MRSFWGDAQCAASLVRTDTVLCVGNHPDSGKPLVQTDGAIFHDSPDLDRERLVLTMLALPNTARPDEVNVLAAAIWASHIFCCHNKGGEVDHFPTFIVCR